MPKSFESKVKSLFSQFAKANGNAHALTIEALVQHGHNNTDWVKAFAVQAFANQQHFRYQAWKRWLEDFTNLKVCEPTEKEPHLTIKVNKDAGRFDSAMLERCKATPFYQYIPADKPLSTPKISESLETVMARGLLTGTITEEEVLAYAATLVAKVKAKQKDSKVVDWAVKYLEQNVA